MLGENFVYFFTVQGFFVGMIFGILKSLDAIGLLSYTFIFTMFFYLFSHIIVALYYRTMTVGGYYFPKEIHEKELDIYLKEIKKREKIIDNASKITEAAAKVNSQMKEADKDDT
ncbi:MAG: hypothetical protein JXQ66_06415 [Campylobacterales bacterium]|nr:hypothetical protein [Campylobacterales bacterium]